MNYNLQRGGIIAFKIVQETGKMEHQLKSHMNYSFQGGGGGGGGGGHRGI